MSRSIATVLSVKIIEARALLAMGVGIGFLTVLSLFGCAATAPPSEHLARSAAAEFDPDCPYLRVQVLVGDLLDGTWFQENRAKKRQDLLAHKLRRLLNQAGFRTVGTTGAFPSWVVHSDSIEAPNGNIAWSILMRRLPTITDEGALLFRKFSFIEENGRPMELENFTLLGVIRPHEIDDHLLEFSESLVRIRVNTVQNQCADMGTTLLEEEAELEGIRDQLTEEIIRVRERRAEQEKQLELEVEQ
jgi:hypothetical protein